MDITQVLLMSEIHNSMVVSGLHKNIVKISFMYKTDLARFIVSRV